MESWVDGVPARRQKRNDTSLKCKRYRIKPNIGRGTDAAAAGVRRYISPEGSYTIIRLGHRNIDLEPIVIYDLYTIAIFCDLDRAKLFWARVGRIDG